MTNILAYINYFTNFLFGVDLLLTPSQFISQMGEIFTFSGSIHLADIIANILANPSLVFSGFVWVLFAIFTIKLLLVLPYRFAKAVIRKCRIA